MRIRLIRRNRWYTLCTIAVWLSLRTQLLAALCLLFTAILGIYSEIDTGYLRIALSFAQLILMVCDSVCTSYSHLVLDGNASVCLPFDSRGCRLISVSCRMERIEDYLDLPQESKDGVQPPAWWPSSSASIDVENLVIQFVLPSFTIRLG